MNPYDLPLDTIESLVAEHGTPLYIVSRSKIVENFQRLDRALPAVTLFYAMKANPHHEILETLAGIGAGFDVASQGEILATLAAGASPRDDLIFADTVKDPKQIAYAHSIGLDDFTYDNSSEIRQIARHAPGANVHVRIAVSNQGSVAHLSSQCLDAQRYVEALETTATIFEQARGCGLDLEMIDIGGGFPVRYLDEQIDIEAMCGTIVEHYRKLFDEHVQLVAEPGRSIVGDAMILVTKVISESVREGKNWLYFDDGTYGSFLEVLLYKMKFPLKTSTGGEVHDYVLAGPTCDCIDVFSRDEHGEICTVALPESIHNHTLVPCREACR